MVWKKNPDIKASLQKYQNRDLNCIIMSSITWDLNTGENDVL